QIIAAPVIHLALLCECEGDLVARENLLDVVAAGAQLHGNGSQAHAVIAPGEDLAVLVGSNHMVKAGGDHRKLSGFACAGNVFELVRGEGAPLVHVSVPVKTDGERTADRKLLGIVRKLGRDAEHAEAGSDVRLRYVLIIEINRVEER